MSKHIAVDKDGNQLELCYYRNVIIEECCMVIESNFWDASDATIIAMLDAIRKLKDEP